MPLHNYTHDELRNLMKSARIVVSLWFHVFRLSVWPAASAATAAAIRWTRRRHWWWTKERMSNVTVGRRSLGISSTWVWYAIVAGRRLSSDKTICCRLSRRVSVQVDKIIHMNWWWSACILWPRPKRIGPWRWSVARTSWWRWWRWSIRFMTRWHRKLIVIWIVFESFCCWLARTMSPGIHVE